MSGIETFKKHCEEENKINKERTRQKTAATVHPAGDEGMSVLFYHSRI